MAATGYTPISLYYSTTASATPSAGNLVAGELALNTTDEKLYFKNAAGTVKLLASNAATTPVTPAGSNTQIQFNNSGSFGASSNLTWDGTSLAVTGRLFNGSASSFGASTWAMSLGNGGASANYFKGDVTYFQNSSGTQIAQLDSTGLGVGTTSPVAKLDVNGSAILRITSATESRTLGFVNSAGTVGWSIGNGVTASADQFVIYSNTAGAARLLINSSGNAGIGTTSPGQLLQVGSGDGAIRVGAGAGLDITHNNSGTTIAEIKQLYAATSASAQLKITSGFTTFQTGTSGTERARVNTGFSVGTTADAGAGAIYATGAITAFYSDKRLKTVSGKIENALDKVGQLSGVYYTNNDTAKSFGYDSDEVQVGVIAQEVEAVLPQIVKAAPFDLDQDGNSKSGQNYKTVQYDKLTPLLIEAINELRAEVTALKGTI